MNENDTRGIGGLGRIIVIPALILIFLVLPLVRHFQPGDLTLAFGLGGLALVLYGLQRPAGGVACLLGLLCALGHHAAGEVQLRALTLGLMLYGPALGLSLALFPKLRPAGVEG